EAHAMAVCIKDDGKILVAGGVLNESFQFDFLMIQLNPDGSFDPDFGINGIAIVNINQFGTLAQDVVIDDNGKILLAGIVGNSDFMKTPAVVRINEDGSLDQTFGDNGVAQLPVISSDNEFTSIRIQPDGKILASGHISLESEPWVYYFAALVARFNPDGSLDNTFGTDGIVVHDENGLDDEFFGMDINPDGEIICGGFTNVLWESFDMFLMKFDTNGNPVADFGDNGVVTLHKEPYNVINDLLVQPDSKILVCGSIGDFAPGDNDFALVRFLENGDLDNTFGGSGYVLTDFFGEQDEANSLLLAGNDKIYVGGKSLNSNGTSRDFTIACYVNDISTEVSSPVGSQMVSVYPNPTSGFMNVDNCKGSLLSLYSINGKLQYSATIGQEQFRVDVSHLPKGIYAVVITGESGIKSSKVVVD
ncbi:MAG: T9SS type A sorting domain-containing protein, partial [Lentimicrobium sp.]|nr:T9SS type A sorting domain-containing protein [Lentimicrobium sp.]